MTLYNVLRVQNTEKKDMSYRKLTTPTYQE